jgi:hypothetical protein
MPAHPKEEEATAVGSKLSPTITNQTNPAPKH